MRFLHIKKEMSFSSEGDSDHAKALKVQKGYSLKKIKIAAMAAMVLANAVMAADGAVTIQDNLANRLHILEESLRGDSIKESDSAWYCKQISDKLISNVGQFDQLAQSQETRGGRVSNLTLSWESMCLAEQKNYARDTYTDEIVMDVMLWGIAYRVAGDEIKSRTKTKEIKELGGTPEPVLSLQERIASTLPPVIKFTWHDTKPFSGAEEGKKYEKTKTCFNYARFSPKYFSLKTTPINGLCASTALYPLDSVYSGVINTAVSMNEVWVVDAFSSRPAEFVKYCKSNPRISAIHDLMKKILADTPQWGDQAK